MRIVTVWGYKWGGQEKGHIDHFKSDVMDMKWFIRPLQESSGALID